MFLDEKSGILRIGDADGFLTNALRTQKRETKKKERKKEREEIGLEEDQGERESEMKGLRRRNKNLTISDEID